MLSSFLLINLVVAVALKQFAEDNDSSDTPLLTNSEIRMLSEHWSSYANGQEMPVGMLARCFESLPPSLARPPHVSLSAFIHMLGT